MAVRPKQLPQYRVYLNEEEARSRTQSAGAAVMSARVLMLNKKCSTGDVIAIRCAKTDALVVRWRYSNLKYWVCTDESTDLAFAGLLICVRSRWDDEAKILRGKPRVNTGQRLLPGDEISVPCEDCKVMPATRTLGVRDVCWRCYGRARRPLQYWGDKQR